MLSQLTQDVITMKKKLEYHTKKNRIRIIYPRVKKNYLQSLRTYILISRFVIGLFTKILYLFRKKKNTFNRNLGKNLQYIVAAIFISLARVHN